MEQLGSFYGGLSGKTKDDFGNGNAKYISYMNVFDNIAIDTTKHDMVKVGITEKQNKVEVGDIVFTGSSETLDECGMSSVLTRESDEPLYLNSFCFGFRLNDPTLLLPGFSKYLFRSDGLRQQIVQTASGVTRYNISKKKMAKIIVPIPPIHEQRRIVSILDKFDNLTNSLQQGLPAEISARQAQYQYYRDQLLTFKEAT
ncbi:MAG: restriction endonuclease subunit S [Clostridiales bacterium]|jgi:type I restriction enzyme S subunit|nr:restriction endonuclease subunit S [Clostridiales bacterium]